MPNQRFPSTTSKLEVTLEIDGSIPLFEAYQKSAWKLWEVLNEEYGFKAVAPHTPRGRGGRFSGWPAHPARTQPRDLQGRFVRRLTDAEQDAAHARAGDLIAQAEERLRWLTDLQLAGHLDADTWLIGCSRELGLFYNLLYFEGKRAAGDPGILHSPNDKALINRIHQDELLYLAGFADALESGAHPMDPRERIKLYAHALWEAFWHGFLMGDLRNGREIAWRFGNTVEHCHDCQRFVDRGWMKAVDFYREVLAKGYSPRSGMLECKGIHCRCYLAERFRGEERELRYPDAP